MCPNTECKVKQNTYWQCVWQSRFKAHADPAHPSEPACPLVLMVASPLGKVGQTNALLFLSKGGGKKSPTLEAQSAQDCKRQKFASWRSSYSLKKKRKEGRKIHHEPSIECLLRRRWHICFGKSNKKKKKINAISGWLVTFQMLIKFNKWLWSKQMKTGFPNCQKDFI